MGSANKRQEINSITTTNTTMKHLSSKNPTTSSDTEDQNPNPNLIENESKTPFVIDNSEEDLILSKSHVLTRIEVTRQRKRKAEQLYKVYDDYLWALSEEYRLKYREYYWNYGKSPFKEDEEQEELLDKKEKIKDENGNFIEGTDENGKLGLNENNGGGGGGSSSSVVKKKKCDYIGCKSKPMALTTCCHLHILSDSKQTLYKACNYIVKRSEERPVHCGKPILRATVPSLCTVHFEKAEVLVTRALKKAGLNISSANMVAPKLHVLVAESVRHINSKRRERRTNVGNSVEEEDDVDGLWLQNMSAIPTEKEKKQNLFDRDFSCQDIPLEQMRTTDGQLASPLPKMVLCQEYKRDGVAGRF